MSIDIEEVRNTLNQVISEFGSFNGETGELLGSQNYAIRSALKLETKLMNKPPAWNGEGLPPVGTVCESLYEANWHKARIAGKDGANIIGRWLEGPDGGSLFERISQKTFRPIRTPEQIQRDEICSVFRETPLTLSGNVQSILADALVKAGYRK